MTRTLHPDDTQVLPQGKAVGWNEFLPQKALPLPEIEDCDFGQGGLL